MEEKDSNEIKDNKESRESKEGKNQNTDKQPDYLKFVNILTLIWTAFSMLYLSAVTFYAVPEGNNRNVDLILGFLIGTAISSLLSFHFGSSRSSIQKEKFIEGIKNKELDHERRV